MKSYFRKLVFLFLMLTMGTIFWASETLVVYSDFALIQSDLFQKSNGLLILPSTNFAIADSLVTSASMNWYRYHRAESYSLNTFLNFYVGKIVKFKFQDGSVKNLKLVSTNPDILQDPQSGMVYYSPSGEYIFPSLVQIDSRNYFILSTPATRISYNYLSTNIGWKAIYNLKIDSSILEGNVMLWNKTDTTFKNFHLFMVAGKQLKNFRESVNYPKALTLSSKSVSTIPNVESTQGYKVYDFGMVKDLNANSNVFLSLFSKKVQLEKLNVSYEPPNTFKKAMQVVRIKHDFPMPRGIVNLYTVRNGAPCYLGQSPIPDSPASSVLEITYGENFDLEVKNVKMFHTMISKDTFVDGYKVYVKNSSDKDQGVWIYKYIPQSSSYITSNDLKIERISANEIRFYVMVKAHSEEKFEYNVQASY